jgi:tetratricopeptide (TPR) repeat protein
MGDLFYTTGSDSLAAIYYAKAVEKETDPEVRFAYYKKLAALSAELKDYSAQAAWLEKYYSGNEKTTNVDLFNWGLAHYRAGEYLTADSIFGIYVTKYPEQSFGYYWQARSNVARDTDIENGLAVPHYQKLIDVLQQDTANANYKKWLVEAYAYLAAYEANTQKDYKEAVDYFEKVLEVDPENPDAKKYIAILEKNLVEEGK